MNAFKTKLNLHSLKDMLLQKYNILKKPHQPFVFGTAHHSLSVLLIVTKKQRPAKTVYMCEITIKSGVSVLRIEFKLHWLLESCPGCFRGDLIGRWGLLWLTVRPGRKETRHCWRKLSICKDKISCVRNDTEEITTSVYICALWEVNI